MYRSKSRLNVTVTLVENRLTVYSENVHIQESQDKWPSRREKILQVSPAGWDPADCATYIVTLLILSTAPLVLSVAQPEGGGAGGPQRVGATP